MQSHVKPLRGTKDHHNDQKHTNLRIYVIERLGKVATNHPRKRAVSAIHCRS